MLCRTKYGREDLAEQLLLGVSHLCDLQRTDCYCAGDGVLMRTY